MRDEETRHAALFNESREPGDVGMASQISGFNVAMPEAGNQENRRSEKENPPTCSKETNCVGGLRRLLHVFDFNICYWIKCR